MDNATNTEVFKDIPHYEGRYQISNKGTVWSVKGQRYLKWNTSANHGYASVMLYKNGRGIRELVHRLVCLTFLGNPPKGMTDVNHKDENKLNNCLDNLEWCTRKYNLNYGNHNRRLSESKGTPVNQFTKTGEFVAEYKSMAEASKSTGINTAHISACCMNKPHCNTAGGYVWKYA